MAIYLEDKERELLKSILEPIVEKKIGKYWIASSLLKDIKSDEERLNNIEKCKHKFGEYTGKKECCVKCGCYDVGMGESWSIVN